MWRVARSLQKAGQPGNWKFIHSRQFPSVQIFKLEYFCNPWIKLFAIFRYCSQVIVVKVYILFKRIKAKIKNMQLVIFQKQKTWSHTSINFNVINFAYCFVNLMSTKCHCVMKFLKIRSFAQILILLISPLTIIVIQGLRTKPVVCLQCTGECVMYYNLCCW